MKAILFTSILTIFLFTSCGEGNSNNEKSVDTMEESTTQLYSCPMHPEVTGAQDDECSKCGMDLTEPVASTQE